MVNELKTQDDTHPQKGATQLLDEAENSSSKYPETWNPETEGDYILGEVNDIRNVVTTYGTKEVAEILVFQQGNKNADQHTTLEDPIILSVWLSSAILKRLWDEYAPTVRDSICIIYQGAKYKKDGTVHYRKYGLAVEKRT